MRLERHDRQTECANKRAILAPLDSPHPVAVALEMLAHANDHRVRCLAIQGCEEMRHHLRIGIQRGKRYEVGFAPHAQLQPCGLQRRPHERASSLIHPRECSTASTSAERGIGETAP